MANVNKDADALALPSTESALCLIPPRQLWEPVDRLRSLYDKAYERWPPHVNLVYPFVQSNLLEQAALAISQANIGSQLQGSPRIILSEPSTFNHKDNNTIHLRPSNGENHKLLAQLAASLNVALGRRPDKNFSPHMTVAQSFDRNSSSHHFLVEKVRTLTELSWDLTELAILVRDTKSDSSSDGPEPRKMRLWGTISIAPVQVNRLSVPQALYSQSETTSETSNFQTSPKTAYHFSPNKQEWCPLQNLADASTNEKPLDRLIVASYNVLGEFEWPPNEDRYPDLVANMHSNRGAADIIVLEEVTDQFLEFLLADEPIRSQYPYSTHGPPQQPEIGPLPNHLNIVVLSKFEMQWSDLTLTRKHKGSPIVSFPTLGGLADKETEGSYRPLILAGIHLSHGLVDGAIANKRTELQKLINYLSATYRDHPWIIAGDFNLPTSSYTLDMARKRRHISPQSYQYLRDFDAKLTDAGLQDAWLESRIQNGESSEPVMELFEGEQGGTFDPVSNTLAAKLVGLGFNNRPQRYDRILINSHLKFRPARFNQFGVPESATDPKSEASDHWGIRCLFQPLPDSEQQSESLQRETAMNIPLKRAGSSLGGLEKLKNCLRQHKVLPDDESINQRDHAIELLRNALGCQGQAGREDTSGPHLILVPAGSVGLGVWTKTSDVDVLCIGGISSSTFFKLAISRLRKAAASGITVIRRIRASSGTMLLLDVNGISFDLHYCGAASILESFPDVMRRPAKDPVFALPPQTLAKLKPVRDIFYLRRSIPDLTQYRVAHLLIKAWAKSRGLYGAKYGLLGGINIAVMLAPVCKVLAHKVGSVSVTDIVVSFFHHYASIDWKTHMVFDPFFHTALNYRRSSTEPLCLLGWHPPVLNTALNSSLPTVQTIRSELKRAADLLSEADITWDRFLGSKDSLSSEEEIIEQGASDFIKSYKKYIRIDINYWGSSSKKRHEFVGWVESRCVMLLVELGRKVPEASARIWPQRFLSGTTNTAPENEESLEYNGCYLVGLEWRGQDQAEGNLQSALTNFENRLRGDSNHCDLNTSWVAATAVSSEELEGLALDRSLIGENAGAGGDFSDDDEDEDDDEEEEENDEIEEEQRSSKKDSKNRKVPVTSNSAAAAAKLRTAVDVMNRLRWDPNMDSDDYIIGYEDRFTGTCEKPLEMWKTDQTDEEFIPQHRILYFKRRNDGVIVWERRTRIDEIFGSGNSKA